MARAKKTETEIKTEAVVTEEKPKRKAGRPPKAKQEETKTAAKRPAARKAVKTAEAVEEKPKRTGGRKKSTEKAAPASKRTAKKDTAEVAKAEKTTRKGGRPARKQTEKTAPQETREEIINNIIKTDISNSGEGEKGDVLKILSDLTADEANTLIKFVKALTAAQKE